jgi:hypothetical protein
VSLLTLNDHLGQQPIGRTVRIGLSNREQRYEIVGLVGDSVYTSPRNGMMATMYVPLAQVPDPGKCAFADAATISHRIARVLQNWSMSLGSLFLLIVGAGPWSLDARLQSRR